MACLDGVDGKSKNFLVTMYGKKLNEHFFENNKLLWARGEIENDLSRSGTNSQRTYEVISNYILGSENEAVNGAKSFEFTHFTS